ncbi:hypothetical protein TCDM_11254 [Trypanosoma cruzi Dm28c]|uniref:Uncharacterized protein n=1 Tax=Trypanosoma cruzi Dm28c TaxID=1416333 RepID=V5D150_TRYCR|nr:hypothetical protein TCDM_11254 [Trypanosoma cruzi Dm28c]
MRESDQRCWVRQPPQTVAKPRSDVTAQHSLAAQLSRQILFHPSLHGVAATDGCPYGQHRFSVQADGWFHRGKLTPPQFIRAGVFMCRHIHREGNGGPFLFPCTAGSTVATCVHRMGHMAHSTQLTIPPMHAHIKATQRIILLQSLSTGSRTILPRQHTYARDSSGCRHSEHTTHPPAQHTHRKIDSGCAPSPPSTSWPRKKTTAATRNCQHALQKVHPYPLQCASCVCVVVCACRNKKQRRGKEGAEHVEGRTKMYSGDA